MAFFNIALLINIIRWTFMMFNYQDKLGTGGDSSLSLKSNSSSFSKKLEEMEDSGI
jgi:hypothetical protein